MRLADAVVHEQAFFPKRRPGKQLNKRMTSAQREDKALIVGTEHDLAGIALPQTLSSLVNQALERSALHQLFWVASGIDVREPRMSFGGGCDEPVGDVPGIDRMPLHPKRGTTAPFSRRRAVATLGPAVNAVPLWVLVISRCCHPFGVPRILSEPIKPKNSAETAPD